MIDDASTDETTAAASRAGAFVVRLAVNLGVGGAVQTGFMYAMRHDYDAVVQVDGDGQHDPRWVRTVVAPLESGQADCVIGSRYLPGASDLRDPDAVRPPTRHALFHDASSYRNRAGDS